MSIKKLAHQLQDYRQRLEIETDPVERAILESEFQALRAQEEEKEEKEPKEKAAPKEEEKEEKKPKEKDEVAPEEEAAPEEEIDMPEAPAVEEMLPSEEEMPPMPPEESVLSPSTSVVLEEVHEMHDMVEELSEKVDTLINMNEVTLSEQPLTEEEFGLGSPGIYGRRKVMPSDTLLRKARKERLAQVRTLRDEFGFDQSTKKTFSPVSPLPDMITEQKLKKRLDRDKANLPPMWKLSELSIGFVAGANPQWVLFNRVAVGKKQPLYRFFKPANVSSVAFSQRAYGVSLLKEIAGTGVISTAKKYGAVSLHAEPEPELKTKKLKPGEEEKECEKVEEECKEEMKEEMKAHLAKRYARALRLAALAQLKNLTDNPLKQELYSHLVEAGVDHPVAMIESAFTKAGKAHFEALFLEAESYMKMSDEAFVEYESKIVASGTDVPEDVSVIDTEASNLRREASRGSLPLTSDVLESNDRRQRINLAMPRPKLHGFFNAS